MEFLKQLTEQLLGQHTLEIWIAGIIWSFIGIIAIKMWYAPKKGFKIKFWINDNLIDIFKGLIWALVILRLGDYTLQLIEKFWDYKLPPTTDFVGIMIVISGIIQYFLHKNRTPISQSMKEKMKEYNEKIK